MTSHIGKGVEIGSSNQRFWWPYWMNDCVCSGTFRECLMKFCPVVSERFKMCERFYILTRRWTNDDKKKLT
jgi:hypothetical protein